ncbi:MAG: hypothetical protein EXR11_04230 [Rhodospirillaceae bacterium]|nr:hypothetical protein [Rhodospirillaceae bacterium]
MNSKGKLLMLVLASLIAAPTAMAQSNTMPDNVRKRLESLSPEQRAQIEQRHANGGQRPPNVTPGQRPPNVTPGQRPPNVTPGQRPPGVGGPPAGVTPGQRPGGATPGQRPPGVGGRPRG